MIELGSYSSPKDFIASFDLFLFNFSYAKISSNCSIGEKSDFGSYLSDNFSIAILFSNCFSADIRDLLS